LCHISTNWLTPFKVREISIAAKEKYLKGWLMEQRVSEFQATSDGAYTVRELPVPYGEPLQLELKSFVNSVVNNTPPLVTAEDGLKALEIALRCIRNG
jgi:predicted dehydrogenase